MEKKKLKEQAVNKSNLRKNVIYVNILHYYLFKVRPSYKQCGYLFFYGLFSILIELEQDYKKDCQLPPSKNLGIFEID